VLAHETRSAPEGAKKEKTEMGLFDTVRDGQVYGKGNYLPAGVQALVEITQCKDIKPRKGPEAFVCNFKIIETKNDKVKEGEEYDWYQPDNDSFPGAMLEFSSAVMGISARSEKDKAAIEEFKDETAEILGNACDPDTQAFVGMRVHVSTVMKITEKRKQEFTRHDWFPYYETPDEARAEYDANVTERGGSRGRKPKPPARGGRDAAPPARKPPPPRRKPSDDWERDETRQWMYDPSKEDWVPAT
jgi:hypothetical protein